MVNFQKNSNYMQLIDFHSIYSNKNIDKSTPAKVEILAPALIKDQDFWYDMA
jgi:hypothetical protein